MIDFSKIPHDRVGLGSTVVVLDVKRDEEVTYYLVTSEEADAANGKDLHHAPIGRALLGKEVGDEVKVQSPGGAKELEILQAHHHPRTGRVDHDCHRGIGCFSARSSTGSCAGWRCRAFTPTC